MANVSIYTTPSCVYCKKTKDFFKEHNIEFSEFDVTTDTAKRDEMIQNSGQMGVPVIDVDGTMVVGFDEPKLRELLNIS